MIKCPYCGKSHYTEDYMVSTSLGWTPVVKDGVRYSEDPNTYTTHCTCLECDGKFAYDNKGNVTEVQAPKEIEEEPEVICEDNNKFNYDNFIGGSNWKKYFTTLVINDEIENFEIKYKGITYKFNLQKVLDKLADVVESVEIINNKD